MSTIITILLIIILSPVILFAGFLVLFAIASLLLLVAIPIIGLISWIMDRLFKKRRCFV